jgi:serine/threonine protein kinase
MLHELVQPIQGFPRWQNRALLEQNGRVGLVGTGPLANPPRVLGRYELMGTLGTGGMASVYLARLAAEAGFQRLYAIKILHPHLAIEPGFVTMLLDEARLAARIHHPNVVPIVDLGTQDSLHYVVLEYVEGCSLSALVKRRRNDRPPRIVVQFMLDAIAGLDAAHSLVDDDNHAMHLVHRDVSPQNILVGVDGTARITDFGIARAESRINTTRPGELKGKYAYMSPEQIKTPATIDHRSDVFSTGAVLWSLLTAKKLFQAENDPATMHNIIELEVPPPSTIGLKPHPAFDAVCLRALQRDPAARFQTMEEMESALREAVAAAGGLASRREAGAWVNESFAEELLERRSAIRVAVANRGTVELPSFTPSADQGTPSSQSPSTPVPAITRPPAPSSSVRRIVFVAAPIIAAVVGWYLFHTLTHRAPPASGDVAPVTTSTPPAPEPAPGSATPPAPAVSAPPLPTTNAAKNETTTTNAAPPSADATTTHAPVRTVPTIRHKAVAQHAATPPTPPTPPKPADTTPPKPATPWDKDSPLPPP